MAAENVKWRVNMAVRRSNLPPAARLIMFVLSDMADAKTGEIPERHSPSLTSLASDTGHGESTVKAQLTELEHLGWVVRSRPDAMDRARHVPTGYRVAVGAEGPERTPHKRKPRAKTKPSESSPEGQEQAPAEGQEMAPEAPPVNESEGQELANRGPGASQPRARSKPSYLKDDDLYDLNDLSAPVTADAAPDDPPATKPKRPPRKPAKPKPADPLGDIAQELTTAFVETHKANVQPFPAIRAVVRAALARDVPRGVLAAALDAVATKGYGISGSSLTVELTRVWNSANGQGRNRPLGRADQIIADGLEREARYIAEEAAGIQTPSPFEIMPGEAA